MKMWRFLLLAVLLAPLFIFPTNVEACTPPPGGLPRYTVADHVNSAPIVLEGTVTKITFQPNTPLHAATIQVIRYFKGSGPSTITVDGYGPSSLCLSSVEQGAHLIFYVRGNDTGVYHAYYKSQFDAIASADSGMISSVMAALNLTTLPTPLPPSPISFPEPSDFGLWLGLCFGLSCCALGVGGITLGCVWLIRSKK